MPGSRWRPLGRADPIPVGQDAADLRVFLRAAVFDLPRGATICRALTQGTDGADAFCEQVTGALGRGPRLIRRVVDGPPVS